MQAVCVFFAVVLGVAAGASTPSCKSDSGGNVDFAYSFKYPGSWDYAYMDSRHTLAKSSHTLTSSSSSITATIMQMHDSGVGHVVWNDQNEHSSSSAPNAHSKGLMLFTDKGGVWLTHSLPHFPKADASGAALWSLAADDFGQSYLCITMTAEEMQKLVPMFNITRPTFYSTKFPDDSFAGLNELSSKGHWDTETMTKTVSVKSAGGQAFHVYGKAGHWGSKKDLYSDLVAPAVGKLFMEGWRRGAGVWGPACGKDEVLDITSVSFPEQDWDVMHDHSKWTVTQSGSTFCVGDLNRADGQDERGGATVCIASSHYAGIMRKVINTTDECKKVADVMNTTNEVMV